MNRLFHQYNRKIWIVFAVSLVIGIAAWPFLPEQLPIHFDATGTPDNYAGKWAIFLAPAVILALTLLAEFFKKYDPKSASYEKFNPYYYQIHFAVSLLMVGIQLYTVAYVSGWEWNLSRIMPVIMGVLFVFIGNVMPKFKHNYFVGIKTSWTLASERVWYLTHRFAGKVWVVGGILMALSALLPLEWMWAAFIGVVVLLVALPLGASFYYFKQEH